MRAQLSGRTLGALNQEADPSDIRVAYRMCVTTRSTIRREIDMSLFPREALHRGVAMTQIVLPKLEPELNDLIADKNDT